MLNICLWFNRKDYEYDVYSLIRAFYPGCRITVRAAGEEETEDSFGLTCRIFYEKAAIRCSAELEDGRKAEERTKFPETEDRAEYKNHLKRLVYRCLSALTGRGLPWGDLTGIRPVKIPLHLLEQGWTNGDIAQYLKETYYVSREKTSLAIATANREKALLSGTDWLSGYSLYIGVPFCPSICLYCSFGSHPLKQWGALMEPYLAALKKELAFLAEQMGDRPLHTIYIGGGTPTTLPPDQLDGLLQFLTDTFPVRTVKEFTVEAGRPDTITEEKLRVLRAYPVSRISINPQTMNQKTLDLIGRKHTVEETESAYALARKLGFDNINMDLIVGLPGEGKEEVAHTLEEMRRLRPDSLTVHSLALKRATRLNLFRDQYADISFENSEEIMEMTERCAAELGMGPYYLYRQKNMAGNFENVGYSAEGKAGLYNILIMEEKQSIMAAGPGASTKFVFDGGARIERAENVKDLKQYIERIDEMLERKRAGIQKYLQPETA